MENSVYICWTGKLSELKITLKPAENGFQNAKADNQKNNCIKGGVKVRKPNRKVKSGLEIAAIKIGKKISCMQEYKKSCAIILKNGPSSLLRFVSHQCVFQTSPKTVELR